MNSQGKRAFGLTLGVAIMGAVSVAPGLAPVEQAMAQKPRAQELPALDQAIDADFEKVVSSMTGTSMWDIYVDTTSSRVIGVLPPDFTGKHYFLAPTISGGVPGANSSTIDGYMFTLRRHENRLVLTQPNLDVRSTGDTESKLSRQMQFTDRFIAEMPIIAMDGKRPAIDLTRLLVHKSQELFPFFPRFNAAVTDVSKAKAFPQNVELAYTSPVQDGTYVTTHYSISELPESTGYEPRHADYRVGYFTRTFTDLASIGDQDLTTRYICRWHIEKADPELELSPPRQPIVFYIEHTTPIRYRASVREAILEWNKAFEKVGIVNAIEVYQQDARTGAHMEKDPEDVRYNFARWSTNNLGFAIGPLRADPRTGQILDADMLMNDGWLRVAVYQHDNVLESMATELLDPETLSWLDSRPDWDPRILLSPPERRPARLAERRLMLDSTGPRPHGGHPLASALEEERRRRESSGFRSHSSTSALHALCSNANHRALDTTIASLILDQSSLADAGEGDLDRVPDEFVNALIKDVMMHEVGHVLGLRHNFSASTLYDIQKINSDEMRGKAFTASVMDYNAANFNHGIGEVQGDYFMPTIGPYDYWAIQYGYELDEQALEGILTQSVRDEHIYHGDEHINGPNPRVRLRDMGRDVLDFVRMEHKMLQELRGRIVERAKARGGSWDHARFALNVTLALHIRDVMTAANWLGGTYTHSDRAGTTDRAPLQPVEADRQRQALQIILDLMFQDEAFGLDTELLVHMGSDRWLDQGERAFVRDETISVHDVVQGIQGTALTLVLNPTTLRRIYDNELLSRDDEDAFTLAETMTAIYRSIWTELEDTGHVGDYDDQRPMVSSLRRNLQSMHVDRLIDLSLPDGMPGAASKPIADLSLLQLRSISTTIDSLLEESESSIDVYTISHLQGVVHRIRSALDAQHIFNRDDV
ncbi:MAG: zinc-dependent metalloprotease [Phycisphaerales bacterium JB043]